jgi:hypothetical protein
MAKRSRPCASASISAIACSAITGESMPRMLVIISVRALTAGSSMQFSTPADSDANQRSCRAALMMRGSQISGL